MAKAVLNLTKTTKKDTLRFYKNYPAVRFKNVLYSDTLYLIKLLKFICTIIPLGLVYLWAKLHIDSIRKYSYMESLLNVIEHE